jgi:cytochrome c peroxidase
VHVRSHAAWVAAWLTLAACGTQATPPESHALDPAPDTSLSAHGVSFNANQLRALARLTPLGPPPADPTNRWADDPAAAHFGQFLFFEPGLSANGKVSCASCHPPEHGFSGEVALAEGLELGTRHAPSILGAGHQRWLGWGGRWDSLWFQALGPLENPAEMGTTRGQVIEFLRADERLSAAFSQLFGPLPELSDEPGVERAFAQVGKAIAAYERRLNRADAPFDRFAAALLQRAGSDPADLQLLSAEATRGLSIFLGRGRCVLCHAGPNFSDGEFHNTGVPPGPAGSLDDPGRHQGAPLVRDSIFNAAGAHSDEREGTAALRVRGLRTGSETWGEFRTPSLRNLAARGPFMHQGQLTTLADVVLFYDTLEGSVGRSHHQELILVPLELGAQGRADLLAFLQSLEGLPLDPALIQAPADPLLAR